MTILSELSMRRLARWLPVIILAANVAHAQRADTTKKKEEPPKIEDNSFLVEEAYNQEYGVVQHINTFQRGRNGNWNYAFTQEWPAPGQEHQLSYTIPIAHPDAATTSVGDIALNYRYQALGKDEEPLWFAPRLSLYLPTGDRLKGTGAGGVSLEVMLPVSYTVSERLVTHWNASGIVSNSASSTPTDGNQNIKLVGGHLGASAIALVSPNFNLMLETVLGRSQFLGASGDVISQNNFVVSPGIRGAFNFESGLQIVPGIAFPIGFGPSDGQRDVLLYLSFEHPFRELRK